MKTESPWIHVEPHIAERGTKIRADITVLDKRYTKQVDTRDFKAGRKQALAYLRRWLGSCRHAAFRFQDPDDDSAPRYKPPRRYASQLLLWRCEREQSSKQLS